ncbi:macro domain-like protein [Atractiella rhizophila]|nr:macro domain-like protein [Atractiella rhizophila]
MEAIFDQWEEEGGKEDSGFDCVVSPANSWGIMDGAFDLVLSRSLSPPKDIEALMKLARATIAEESFGYLPPGSCAITSIPVGELSTAASATEDDDKSGYVFPNYMNIHSMAICPTMSIPADVRWHRELCYTTVWNLLCQLEKWNQVASATTEKKKIRRVLMTGLATGVGVYEPDRCAKQMMMAFKHFWEARDVARSEAEDPSLKEEVKPVQKNEYSFVAGEWFTKRFVQREEEMLGIFENRL